MMGSPSNPEAAQEIRRVLRPDETLLWSGMPRQGVVLRIADPFVTGFGLFITVFSLNWIPLALADDEMPIITVLWGVPFVIVGANLALARYFVDRDARASTYYGLTDRRVIILSGRYTPSIASIPLKNLTEFTRVPLLERLLIPGEDRLFAMGLGFELFWPLRSDLLPSDAKIEDPVLRLVDDPQGLRRTIDAAGRAMERMPVPEAPEQGLPMDPGARDELVPRLEPGESLLCATRPKRGLLLNPTDHIGLILITLFILILVGTGFEGASLSRRTLIGYALSALVIGLALAVLAIGALHRARTSYGLTDRRAIVVSGIFFRSTRSVPLGSVTHLTLRERGQGLGTLFLTGEPKFRGWRRYVLPGRASPPELVFKLVRAPRRIHDAMLDRILASQGGA